MSCHSKKEDVAVRKLQHVELDIPNLIIGSPGGLQKKGNNLIILDYKSDSLFHLIDINSKRYVGMFGGRGQGPNELNHPNNIHFSGNRMYCYDVGKSEIKQLELDATNINISCSTVFRFKNHWRFDAIPIAGQRFVVNGCFEDAMFGIINEQNEILYTAESYPYKDEVEQKIPSRFRAMAYQGTMRLNNKGYMAFATSNAKLLYLYNISNGELEKLGEVIDRYAQYIPDASMPGAYSVALDGKKPQGYTDLAVNDHFIFALYSGRSFKEYKMSCSESEYIYVYDWNGKLVSLYKLDVPVNHICIDEMEKKIYAISNLPDPVIVTFDYNEIRK